MVVIDVRNAELMETLTKEAKRLNIDNGAIVSLIGAVDSFTISTMPKHDATKDLITNYILPAEMTGTGEITNGTVHIHAVMAIEVIKHSQVTSTARKLKPFSPASTSFPVKLSPDSAIRRLPITRREVSTRNKESGARIECAGHSSLRAATLDRRGRWGTRPEMLRTTVGGMVDADQLTKSRG